MYVMPKSSCISTVKIHCLISMLATVYCISYVLITGYFHEANLFVNLYDVSVMKLSVDFIAVAGYLAIVI